MKPYLLSLLAALLLGLVVIGCASSPPDVQGLIDEIHAARAPDSEGGAQITEAESARIEARLPAQGFDWAGAAIAAGQIGLAILGVKVLPGSVLRGPWDPKEPSLG